MGDIHAQILQFPIPPFELNNKSNIEHCKNVKKNIFTCCAAGACLGIINEVTQVGGRGVLNCVKIYNK